MNEVKRRPAYTVTELASARQHQLLTGRPSIVERAVEGALLDIPERGFPQGETRALAAVWQLGETWRGGQQGTRICSSSSQQQPAAASSRIVPPPFFSGTGKPHKRS